MDFIGLWDRRIIDVARSKAVIACSRLVFLVLFFCLIQAGGGNSFSEDFFLLIFLQICTFVALRLPETLASPQSARHILLVVDFLLLSWGMTAYFRGDGPPPWAVILFFPAMFAVLVMTPRFSLFLWVTILGGATLFPVATGMGGGISLARFAGLELFWIAMCLYLCVTALPVNATVALLNRFGKAAERSDKLFQLCLDLSLAPAVKDMFQACANNVLQHFPEVQVDAIKIVGEQAELILRQEIQGRVPSESASTPMKECLATGSLSIQEESPPPHRSSETKPLLAKAATGATLLLPLPSTGTFEKGYLFRLVWPGPHAFREEELAYFRSAQEMMKVSLRRLQALGDLSEEKKELLGKYLPLQREHQDARCLATVLETLCASSAFEECLKGLSTAFQQTLDVDATFVFFLDPSGILEPAGVFGRHPVALPPVFRLALDRSLVGDCVRNNKVLVLGHLKAPEKEEDQGADYAFFLKAGLKSIIALPLSQGSAVYGCLLLGGVRQAQFKVEDMNLLSRIQATLGKGMHLCRMRDAASRELVACRRKARLFEGILQAYKAGTLSERLGPIFQESFELDWCRFYTLSPASPEWSAISGDLDFDPANTLHGKILPDPLLERAWRQGEGIIVPNTLDDPDSPDFNTRRSSRLVAPVLHEGDVVGMIDLVANRECAFSASDLAAAAAAAEMVALCLVFGRMARGRNEAATVDLLTGLPDRNRFLENLDQEAKRCQESQKPYVVIMLDVDDIGRINAEQGIKAGDNVIRTFSEIVRNTLRAGHFAARTGGNAFSALMPETNLEKAVPLVRKMLDKVRSQVFPGGLQVRCSAGLASFPVHGPTAAEVFSAAEQALRRIKQRGKDSFAFPDRELFPVQGKSSRIDLADIFREILGTEKKPGPHTAAGLSRLILHLDSKSFDPYVIGDVLYRLILMLDYPERHNEYFNLVPEMVVRLAKEMNFTTNRLRDLLLAAKVYDIGKFTLEDRILYATRPLDESELKDARDHVGVGVRQILQPHKMFAAILASVRFHHERWDGSGYPWQLKGDEIPLESQILGVVDVFKALVTERPYKQRLSTADSMAILQKMKNSMFEPTLVEAFFKIIDSMKVLH